jgi:hypothetical protein
MFKETKPSELLIAKPGLHLVKVDSDVARDWLRLNIKNRRIRKTLVAYLRRQIESNEWQSNHPQPIVFSDAGRLIDGQHRLTAIAEAEIYNGSSVKMRVETGADDKIREYMDTGITRTLDDRVELDSDLVFNKFVSQIISIDMMLGNKTGKYGKATPEDAKEFFTLHEKALRLVYDRHRREKATGQVAVSLAAMQYFEKDAEKADEFYSDIFVAAGNVQQAQMLRDYLFRTVNARGGYTVRKEVYSKAVGCMKAHMEGRHVAKVTRAGSW